MSCFYMICVRGMKIYPKNVDNEDDHKPDCQGLPVARWPSVVQPWFGLTTSEPEVNSNWQQATG